MKALVTLLCPTLCDPMDCSPPGSSAHGNLQARILERVAIPFFRRPSQPRDWTPFPCFAGRFFTVWAVKEPDHPIWPSHNVFLLFFKHSIWLSHFSLLSLGLRCFASSSSYSRTLYHQDLFEISPIPRGLLCLHQLGEISLVTLGWFTLLYFSFLHFMQFQSSHIFIISHVSISSQKIKTIRRACLPYPCPGSQKKAKNISFPHCIFVNKWSENGLNKR